MSTEGRAQGIGRRSWCIERREARPVAALGELLQGEVQPRLLGQSLPLPVLLVHAHDQQFAVQVDSLAASREIVVKSLGPQFAGVHGLAGATLLGDGRVVLILDLLGQLRGQQRRLARLPSGDVHQQRQFEAAPRQRLVMVVDDSVTVRKVTSRLLERHGMSVLTAKDGVDAMLLLEEHMPDLMLLDIEMPRMDGFEVATRIRRDERLKGLRVDALADPACVHHSFQGHETSLRFCAN